MFDGRFRSGVDAAVKPLGEGLRRTPVRPDHLTALGLLLSVPTAWAIGTGRLGLGLVLLIAAAVPDLLDGALAKASGRSSVRGAFFDSVCDRVTDTFVLGGLAWYLQDHHHGHAFMLPMAILGASLLISYERAKAESLGFDAKGGLMERAERVVVLCVGLALSFLLVPLLWVMLGLTVITALQRFRKVWVQATVASPQATDAVRPPVRTPVEADARAGSPVSVTGATDVDGMTGATVVAVGERWRAWREANGWTPKTGRYTQGTRRAGSAAYREERRQARVARRQAHRSSGPRRRP